MLVEAAILDELDAAAQERRHVGGRHDQAVLAVDRKDAADHRRIETEHRQVVAVRQTHAGDGGIVGMDGDALRQRAARR